MYVVAGVNLETLLYGNSNIIGPILQSAVWCLSASLSFRRSKERISRTKWFNSITGQQLV